MVTFNQEEMAYIAHSLVLVLRIDAGHSGGDGVDGAHGRLALALGHCQYVCVKQVLRDRSTALSSSETTDHSGLSAGSSAGGDLHDLGVCARGEGRGQSEHCVVPVDGRRAVRAVATDLGHLDHLTAGLGQGVVSDREGGGTALLAGYSGELAW